MIARQHIDIRRTTNIVHAGKAYEYARGIELWATRLLAQDLRQEEEKIDHLDEAWAKALPRTDVAGGTLTGRIEDLQGRFNLNNLVQSGTPEDDEQTRPPMESVRFEHLLERCDLPPGLVWSVMDWLDEDTNRFYPDGAEDYAYLGLDAPYRAANAPMVSPSELSLVHGFDYDAYACLEPFIATLPAYTAINVNTASVEVLMALLGDITETQAIQLVERRQIQPYESVDDFLEAVEDIGISTSQVGNEVSGNNLIGVNSSHYLVIADTQIGTVRMRLFSQVERLEDGNVRVLLRGRESL